VARKLATVRLAVKLKQRLSPVFVETTMPNPTFTGLLAEWAEGCSAETLAWLALPRDDESKPEHWDALRALFAADTALHFGGRCRPSSDDVERLRTLILRRLGGAERARGIANEAIAEYARHPSADLESYDVGRIDMAKETLEALDG
jgi:hypothetical protein